MFLKRKCKNMKIKSMKTIRVVAAVIRQNGKIFATQRGYGEWKDGWEFPVSLS